MQELLKSVCIESNVTAKQDVEKCIDDISKLENAINQKAHEYSTRHLRALEDIAKGQKSAKNKEEEALPLYLPYYFVKSILNIDFNKIITGIERRDLEEEIKKDHHRKEDVRPSDMSNLLHNLAKLQIAKLISPPIFDYDRTQRTVKVIDSTFYFFLKNVDTSMILEDIPNPLD